MDFMLLGHTIQVWIAAIITAICMMRLYKSNAPTPNRKIIDCTVFFVTSVVAGVFLHPHLPLPMEVSEVVQTIITCLSFDTIIQSSNRLIKSKKFFQAFIEFYLSQKK